MFLYELLQSISLVPTLLIVVPASVIILIFTYIKLRPKFPVRVTCWFCHKKSDVPYDNRNCWDCRHCEQYNGFSADGGYNKIIPAQHDELLNHSVSAKSSFTKKSPITSAKSPLCRKCTINQDLKIQQLSSFTPRDPSCFDEEVEEYRQHLERAYQLCKSCEQVVQQTLQQQQGWLLEQHRKHLQSLPSQPTQRVIAWWQRGISVTWLQRAQIVTTVSAFSLLLSQNHGFLTEHFSQFMSPDIAYLLEIAPNYDHIVASIVTSAIIIITGCCALRRRVDIITCVLWLVLLIHKWLMLLPYMKSHASEEDLKMGHVVVILLTFVTNAIAIVTTRQVCHSKLSMKRLCQPEERIYRGRNITEHFNSPVVGEHLSEKSPSSCSSEASFLFSTPVSQNTGLGHPDKYAPVHSAVSGSTPMQSSFPSDELEWGFGKLSLGPSDIRNRSSVFQKPSFSAGNDLQGSYHNSSDANHSNSKHSPLLRPPKLNIKRNVTQTSWVAGGYWRELGGSLSKAVQSGRNLLETSFQTPNLSPLSRTSSQSSGFHSRSSNSPASSPNSGGGGGSCSGSLCGGDDRFSILSESAAPQSCQWGHIEHPAAVSKMPHMSMPYYGGFPVCYPHMWPVNIATTSLYNPNGVSWMMNPNYFGAPKQYFQNSFSFSSLPKFGKQFPLGSVLPLEAFSHTGSSCHLPHKAVVPGPVENNLQNMWQIMKQNIFLSVLCIGSFLVNVLGITLLILKNVV